MSERQRCVGLIGRLFGHKMRARYSDAVSYPEWMDRVESLRGQLQMEKKTVYEGEVCERCGQGETPAGRWRSYYAAEPASESELNVEPVERCEARDPSFGYPCRFGAGHPGKHSAYCQHNRGFVRGSIETDIEWEDENPPRPG